jgi:RNA polymerase sigma factor (sigma-70 family)
MSSRLRFKYLENRYKDRIFNYAMWLVKNRQDAEDITQEVLIKIWEQGLEIRLSAIKSWIMRTTHNLSIDYLRKRSVKYRYEQRGDEDFVYSLPDEERTSDPRDGDGRGDHQRRTGECDRSASGTAKKDHYYVRDPGSQVPGNKRNSGYTDQLGKGEYFQGKKSTTKIVNTL